MVHGKFYKQTLNNTREEKLQKIGCFMQITMLWMFNLINAKFIQYHRVNILLAKNIFQ